MGKGIIACGIALTLTSCQAVKLVPAEPPTVVLAPGEYRMLDVYSIRVAGFGRKADKAMGGKFVSKWDE